MLSSTPTTKEKSSFIGTVQLYLKKKLRENAIYQDNKYNSMKEVNIERIETRVPRLRLQVVHVSVAFINIQNWSGDCLPLGGDARYL